MKLLQIILAFLFFQLCTEVKAQWSVKHLDESEYATWSNILKFKNDSLGLFMGDHSVILKSVDAGETWNPVRLKTKVNLYDFQFVDDSTVYATGDYYTGIGQNMTSKLIKSVDNGDTWDSIASFSGKQIYSLHFFSVDSGLVAGYDGIYRTTDSGNHWDLVWSIRQFGYQYGDINQIRFPTSQVGYAIGLGRTQSGAKNNFDNFLLKTTDSGIKWDTICSFKQSLTSLYFLNADSGFIGNESQFVLKTINGGHTWTEKEVANLYGSTISSFHFISNKTGFATGAPTAMIPEGSSSFFISKTIDGGETWETFNSAGIPLNSIYFMNDTVGFVSGQLSLIMKTTGKINELPADYPWHLVQYGAVKDINSSNSLVKVFPNPTTGMLTIQLKNPDQPVETIRLLNASGQMMGIGKPKFNSENIPIDLSGLSSGVYLIELTFSNKRELIKVLKK